MSNLNSKGFIRNKEFTKNIKSNETIYFENETNADVLNQRWKELVKSLNDNNFWKAVESFLNEFDRNYSTWDDTCKSELCKRCDLRSETYPELDRKTIFSVSLMYEQSLKEYEENPQIYIDKILSMSFFVYLLSLPTFNRELFIDNGLPVFIISLVQYIIEESDKSEKEFLVLLYSFKSLNSILSSSLNMDIKASYNKTTLLTMFLRTIKFFKIRSFTRIDYAVCVSMLEALSSSLRMRSHSMKMKNIKILDHILSFIGWPGEVSPNIWEFDDIRCKFILQMRFLNALSASFQVKANIQRWFSRGGFMRIIDFIFFTACSFPTQEAPIELLSQTEMNIDPPSWKTIITPGCWIICNHNLKHLFDILTTMCLNSLTSSKKASGSIRAKKEPTFLISSIISLIMGMYSNSTRETTNNMYARKFIKEMPEVQLNTISFISNLVEHFQYDQLEFFKPLWTIIENDEYFLKTLWDETKESEISDENKKVVSTYLKATLGSYVFQFLEFVSITTGNIEQTEYILQLIHTYIDSGPPQILARATGSILLVSMFNIELAAKCVISYGYTELIRMIINLSERIQTETNEEVKNLIIKGRSNLIKTAINISETKYGHECLLKDYTTFEEIFSFLPNFDYDAVENFSIPLLVGQMVIYDSTENIDNYRRLYSRYADVIVKAKSRSFKLTRLLVEGIIKVLSDDIGAGHFNSKVKERQILFSQYNLFAKLISLLDDCQPNDPDVKALCISIIRCLTSLFKNNNQNKEYFKNTIGYAKLEEMILHVFNQDLSGNSELIFELVRMLLDGRYPIEKNPLGIMNQSIKELTEQAFLSPTKNILTPNVTNPHVATVLLHLLPYFNKNDRSVILRTFNDLASSSSVNITKFCSVGVLEICLDIIKNFQEESEMVGIFELISTLSSNNITVREFRKMLRIFEPFDGDVRSQWTFNLLQSLEEMIENGVGPRYYFDFDGIQSAFILPAIPKWSNDGKGFTICTRIKVESFFHPNKQEEYNPRLFSFANNDGVGWELFFSNSNLCFRILQPNRVNDTKRFDIKFNEKEWYTIAFCFSLTNRIIGKSGDIRLFVYSDDGITFARETVNKCPNFSNLTKCIIGSCSKVLTNVSEANTFYGQIGEIIFLGDDLQDRVKVYLEAGHKMYGEWSNVFDGLVHAHSIFDYSPMAIDMNAKFEQNATTISSPICYDLSLHCRDAKILDGLDVVHRRHARNNISCFGGGVFVIFPLLLLLDKHKSLKFKKVFKDVIDSDDSDIELRGSDSFKKVQSKWKIAVKMYNSAMESHSLLDQMTRILLKVIQSSKELQIQMIEEKGFAIFAYLLLKNSPKHLSKNFLTIIMSTLDKPELPDSIKEHLIEYIFCDFNLWIYTDFNVQKFLLTKVIPYSISSTPNTRNIITLKRLLEIIRTFYWTVASPDVMATDLIVHPVTKHVIAQRPVLEEIGHLRGYSMVVFNELISKGITLEDTKAIIHFLIDCKDPVLSEEMFFKVRTILEHTKHRKDLIDHIITIGHEVLLCPLKSKINTIRSQAIYFICILNSYFSSMKIDFPGVVMLKYLKRHLPDKRIYKILLNASIGSYHRRDSSEKLCLDDQSYIKNSFIIPVALKLALKDKSQDLQVNFLRDFKLLIEFKDKSKEELMTIAFWEMILLSFLSPSNEYLLTDSESRFEKYKSDIVTDIFVSIAHYKIKEEKNAVEYFYNLVYWYQASAMERNISSLDEFFLSFLRKVLDPIHEELKALLKEETYHFDILNNIDRKDSCTISNIVHVVFFVADYIVLSTKSVGDAIMSSLIVRNSGLPLILMEVISIIESIPAFQCSVDPLPYSGNTFKNGTFRVASGIPLVYKIAFMQIYNHKDVKILHRCIECINNRLSRRAKKEDAYYIAFHVLNSLSFSITFLSQDKKSENEERSWINNLSKYTLPLVGTLIKNFKPQFAELRGFDTDYLEYLQELSNSASSDLLISQPRYLENLLLIFQNRLTDIHKIDKESIFIDKLIKKNSKALYSKYMQYCTAEKELKAKALDRIDTILMNNFSSDYREISSIYFKEYYSKVARRWRNIARTLTGERGPWGTQKSITHWKLDKVENHLRMRMRLVQNHNFNSHEDALKQKSKNQKREELLNQINLDDVNLEISTFANELNDSGRPYLREEMLEMDLPNASFDEEERNDHFKTILVVECELIQPLKVIKGILEITTKHLHFKEVRNEEDYEFTEPLKEKIWNIDHLKHIYLRRYLLKRSALEIFLTNQTSYFLNFNKIEDKRKVYDKIKGLNPPNLEREYTKEECLQLWMKRKISNFEYLMCLNTLAGRTYNDLSQYPVFPWVVMDMESETIDLNDPKIYRDFTKPVGALNPERLKQYLERYESLPETKRFHYGSHYSSAATVLFYLVRVEPFTSLFIKLHDNSFDHPDRMFFSIPQTLHNCLQSTGDVKELIPEFFYFPDMLENSNRFNFGKRQSGITTDHVDLPPWAKTPEEFIHIHRLALESEYVSNNLHHWIDLIFGYKQRGKAAMDAYNLFHYFTYEGTVDIDKITDPVQREAVETMISEFGQTPIQLFFEPHPQRGKPPKPEIIQPLQPKSQKVGNERIIWISVSSKKGNIIYLDIAGKLYMSNKADFIDTGISTKTKGEPFIFVEEPRLIFPHFDYLHEAFALSKDGQLLIAPRLEVSGIKCINLESKRRHQNLTIHKDLVTSMGLTEDGSILITGSRDTTLVVWKVENRQGTTFVNENSIAKLYGHDDAIACISVSSKIGICVSVSKDNTCIIHSLKDYSYVRVVDFDPSLGKIERIALSIQGYIIFLSKPNRLSLFSINGKYLRTIEASEMPTCMVISLDGEYLITGGKDSIIIRAVYDFKLIRRIYVDSTVISINLDEKHIVAGLDDGRILITGFNLV